MILSIVSPASTNPFEYVNAALKNLESELILGDASVSLHEAKRQLQHALTFMKSTSPAFVPNDEEGGVFEYAFGKVRAFADCLDICMLNDTHPVSKETLRKLVALFRESLILAEKMQAAEWFFSDNIDEAALNAWLDSAEFSVDTQLSEQGA